MSQRLSKPFWPPALASQAPPAIIFAVLHRFRGPALFGGPRPSSRQGAPFWPSGLTLRSSGPAFCGPLTLAVGPYGGVMSIVDKVKKEITEIEHRTDLSDEQKVLRITHIACATCAGVAIQPIPFADIFVLTPIQAYFASRIAAIRGVPVSESDAADWIKEIVGIVGMGIIAQQVAIGIWKLVTFGAGGLLTIPLVYGLTYAVMKASDAYFSAKARNVKLTDEQIKTIWKGAFQEGKKKGSDEEQNIKARKE